MTHLATAVLRLLFGHDAGVFLRVGVMLGYQQLKRLGGGGWLTQNGETLVAAAEFLCVCEDVKRRL